MKLDLNTKAVNTWCPGCTNFMILAALKNAVAELVEEGKLNKDNFTLGAGIGCHGRLPIISTSVVLYRFTDA